MFNRSRYVIYIDKTTVKGAMVIVKAKPEIKNLQSVALAGDNLAQVLATVLKKLKADNVYLLLGEGLVYTLEISISASLAGKEERDFIFEQIKVHIPEVLTDKMWDFAVKSQKGKEKQIFAFAPVKDEFRKISDAFNAAKCKVRAIEPLMVASTRNPDPLIGIALKKDLSGKDEQVLNLPLLPAEMPKKEQVVVPEGQPTELSAPPPAPPPAGSVIRPWLLLALIATIVFAVVSIGGVFWIRARTEPKKFIEIQVTPTPTTTPTAKPTPTLDLSLYTVQVLNGSGVTGAAASASALLKEMGFEKVKTGTAAQSDYVQTQLRIKDLKEAPQLADYVKQALVGYEVVLSDPLQDNVDFDLLIVVGQKNE